MNESAFKMNEYVFEMNDTAFKMNERNVLKIGLKRTKSSLNYFEQIKISSN